MREVASAGELQFSVAHEDDRPESLEYTPAGKQIVTRGTFGTVRVLNASTGEVIHELRPDRDHDP